VLVLVIFQGVGVSYLGGAPRDAAVDIQIDIFAARCSMQ
jgi:hypothetical protein